MWPSTGLCFTENHPSVSIIHIQSQTVFVAVFFLCFYGKPPLCLSWFSSGSTLSFHQTHPITNCTCRCVFFVRFYGKSPLCLSWFSSRSTFRFSKIESKKGTNWTFFFYLCQDKINKFSNQLVILVFGSVQPLLSACLGFPQDRPSGLLPLLLSLLLCGALCRKLYNWVVSHQKRTRPWSHQCHQREGGGVRVQVEWRALGEAGQWSLCATRLLLHSVPLVVGDGAIVLAAPLLELDKISFKKVIEAKMETAFAFQG